MNNLRIFGLGSSRDFANRVCDLMGMGWVNTHHEERRPDGEAYTTSRDNVRGCDVYVITSLYGDDGECVDQKLMKAAIFVNTLRHASAERITLVAPYLCYMRQDRKTESRAPIATQAVAMMLEAVGMDRLLTMDVHNQGAEQNAFRVPIDILEAKKLLADTVADDLKPATMKTPTGTRRDRDPLFKDSAWPAITVLSPDAGGVNRTKAFQVALARRLKYAVGIAYADKTRVDSSQVRVNIVGDVDDHIVVVVDDMISTGGTLQEISGAVREAGGVVWGVAATHGLFVDGAPEKLAGIPRIYVTDTIPPFRLKGTRTADAVKIVSTAQMFAEAIRRIHTEGGSISQLLND